MINKIGYNQGGYGETVQKEKNGRNSGTATSFASVFQAEQTKINSAKDFLTTLQPDELAVLQKASHLADPIDIYKISEEGARNLLAKGDATKYVDLNNDGITEIGAAKDFIFPPPNSPQAVKDAWGKVSANMTSEERMLAIMPFLVEQLKANTHQLPDGSWYTVKPGEPGYVNILAGDSQDFCSLIRNMIEDYTAQLQAETNPEFKKHREFQVNFLGEFLECIQDYMKR